jgi:hypothetical protein
MSCPKCNANDWAMGPEGGGSQNVLCRNCLTEYCESAFGLEPMKFDAQRMRHLYGPDVTKITETKYSILDDMIDGL